MSFYKIKAFYKLAGVLNQLQQATLDNISNAKSIKH